MRRTTLTGYSRHYKYKQIKFDISMTKYILCCIQRIPPRWQGTGDREPEATDVRRHSAPMHDEHHTYYETDRRGSNYGAEPPV